MLAKCLLRRFNVSKKLVGKYKVIKSFNNNIVLVEHEGKEMILFSKGIGFNKKKSDIIPQGISVDKIFVIEDEQNIMNFNRVIEVNNKEFLALCEELILYISNELNEELSENIHIGLIDHLSFAIKRIKSNEVIDNPFLVEIETLYPKEYYLAEKVINDLSKAIDMKINKGEIGFIAMHIHSARNNGILGNTIKCSYIAKQAIDYLEDIFEIKISKKSIDYARFITHLRFAIERLLTNVTIKNELLLSIKRKYKKSFEVAKEIARIIEGQLDISVPKDEIGYLAIHVERLKNT